MTRQQIEQHPAWLYISKLSNEARYKALTGEFRSLAENNFGVKIEEYPFTAMNDIPDDCARISAIDSFRNIALILVLKTK